MLISRGFRIYTEQLTFPFIANPARSLLFLLDLISKKVIDTKDKRMIILNI